MNYYIHSPSSGWHEVPRKYYRDYVEYLRVMARTVEEADAMIARNTRKSDYPLDIVELVNGGETP